VHAMPSEGSGVFRRSAPACFSAAFAARIFSCYLRDPAFCMFGAASSFSSVACFCLFMLVGLVIAFPLVASCPSLCFGADCQACPCSFRVFVGMFDWGGMS
jgi:hypothetical protein